MFQIIKDGVYLDLNASTLRWETVNTLFEGDALQNDYSFPFTFPCSATNLKAFGFINDAAVPKATVTFDVILQFGGRSLQSKLILNGIKRNGFNASIAGGILGLNNADKTLKEVLSDIAPINITDFTDLSAYSTADYKNVIAFPPHSNAAFYGTNNTDFCGVINRQNADTGAHLINTIITGNKYCIVPFIYLHYILQYIFAKNGIAIDGDYWRDTEVSNILVYNNYALDKITDSNAYVNANADRTQMIYNLNAPGVSGTDRIYFKDNFSNMNNTYSVGSDVFNLWNNTTGVYTIPNDNDYSFRVSVMAHNLTPYSSFLFNYTLRLMYQRGGINHVLASTSTYDGGGYSTSLLVVSDSLLAGDAVWVEMITTGGQKYHIKDAQFTAQALDITSVNTFENNVFLSNHVPDITVADLLKEVKNIAQLDIQIDWENKTASFNYAENIIDAPPTVDLTAVSDPYPEQLLAPKVGYTVSYDFGSNDGLLTDNFKPYKEAKIIGSYPYRTAFPQPAFDGDLAIELRTNKLWQAQFSGGGFSWNVFSDLYYPISEGKKGVEFKIGLAPMFMTALDTNEGTGTAQLALMPTISEQGNSTVFNLGTTNTMSLRIIFMRGIYHHISTTGQYVFASATKYNFAGVAVGNYTLKLQDADGWYNRYLKKIMLAIDNNEVFEYKIMMPLNYLFFKGKVQIKNVNYLVKNISTIAGKTIKQSVVRFLKLP